MEIKEIKTYRTAFGAIAMVAIIIALMALIGCFGMAFFFFKKSQEGYQSIWIVDPKTRSVFQANQAAPGTNPERKFEYENHINMFYHNWFEFDQYSYKEHIDRGLNYLGNCGKNMLSDYNAQNWQRRLIEKNLSCKVQVDSIIIDMTASPVRGNCFAIQTLSSPAGEVKRRLYSNFTIHDISNRSSQNPHGCLIDDFVFIDQSKVE